MKLKIINKSNNENPAYAEPYAAGLDLRAFIEGEDITLLPNQRVLIPTGNYIQLHEGTFAMITPRSGLSLKYGITIVNAPGIIDSSYRGELKVILINLGNEPFVIHNGDRIAQMVICEYKKIEWEAADVLSETERGTGGFSSTGIK